MPSLLVSVSKYRLSFALYLIVGFSCALAEWITFYVASRYAPIYVSLLVSFVIATILNQQLSRRVVFTSKRKAGSEFALVVIASGVAFAGNLIAFQIFRSAVNADLMAAKVSGTVVGFLLNFALRQFVVFSSVPKSFEAQARSTSVDGPSYGRQKIRQVESGVSL